MSSLCAPPSVEISLEVRAAGSFDFIDTRAAHLPGAAPIPRHVTLPVLGPVVTLLPGEHFRLRAKPLHLAAALILDVRVDGARAKKSLRCTPARTS